MPDQHKLAGAHVAVTTSVSADRLAALARYVGINTRRGLNKVRFEGATPGILHFSIRSLDAVRPSKFAFHLQIQDASSGSTARSGIDSYLMTQDRYMHFIPAGRWKMQGYGSYKLFMTNLRDAVRLEDPAAEISITRRER